VITTNSADARFLRRVLMALVILTLVTGSVAAYTTLNAMTAEGLDLCQATGFLCMN
jgi:fluoride ion exporter CrcB/FEX